MAINKIERVAEANGHSYWRVVGEKSQYERCANKALAESLRDYLNNYNRDVSDLGGTVDSGHYAMRVTENAACVLSYEDGVLTDFSKCSNYSEAAAREAEMQRRSAALPLPRQYSSHKPIGLPEPEESDSQSASPAERSDYINQRADDASRAADKAVSAQSNAQPTANQDQEEEEVMATTNKIDIKSEAIEAGVRTSVTQVVKLLHEPLVALITAKLSVPGEDPSAFAKRVSEFLKEDIGRAVVSALLGLAFQNLPPAALASIGIDATMGAMVAKELRVNAMALVGGEVADLLMDPIRQAASGLAAQTGGKVRAVFEQNGIGVGVLNQEEEVVVNPNATAKAQEMGITR